MLSQVTGIRDAATESEVVVREITRDIQSLDLAKKNLIASMNALKRFQMLGEQGFPIIVNTGLEFFPSSERLRPAYSISEIQEISGDSSGLECRQAIVSIL